MFFEETSESVAAHLPSFSFIIHDGDSVAASKHRIFRPFLFPEHPKRKSADSPDSFRE